MQNFFKLKKSSEIVQNSVLFAASVFIALLAGELILRFTKIGYYSVSDRVLFYSNPSFVMSENRAVKYSPNSKIRSVAIYGNYIDYDVVYHTNNMGFIDSIPYGKTKTGTKNIAFIGDSFTAGSGSNNPWVTQLRKLLLSPDIAIYNLGVSGTGILHFHKLLKSLEGIIPFEEVNIMVISNDFFRGLWYPYFQGNGLWFCYAEDNCPNTEYPIIYIANYSESKTTILAHANKIYKEKRNNRDGELKFYQKLRLYNLLCDVYGFNEKKPSLKSICPHLKIYQVREYQKNHSYTESIEMLGVILAEYPAVKFRLFHIPEKGEVYTDQYSFNVDDDIKQIGLEYIPLLQTCNWKASMYHKHDSHLNDAGYSHLAKCMAGYFNGGVTR